MKRFVYLLVVFLCGVAHAAGPRWVAGSKWTNVGSAMGWYRNDVQYFIDPGALSGSVSNSAAVAMVDAAAAVWNLKGLAFTLKNGGSLAEDVNSTNVYLGPNGIVWPQDVASANYAAKQIAVVFDADGTITDTLLGAGASAPSNCRTSGVTENVDLFVQPGKIAHAILVVNGRCSGLAPEQQLQLQYQLMRMFGRVLGLGWSQLNDNVYTGSPAPTYIQQMHWPIMHPIDIICGVYTYQCLPQPFTLRDDDIASMWVVNGGTNPQFQAGGLVAMNGNIQFPGNIPMAGVNVVVKHYQLWGSVGLDSFESVSAVSGAYFLEDRGNPVTGSGSDTQGLYGGPPGNSSYYNLYVPMNGGTSWLWFFSQSVNPLYVGQYAVGPYRKGTPSMSGASLNYWNGNYAAGNNIYYPYTASDAAYDCTTGNDGSQSAPAMLPASGTWDGRLCSSGHSSWLTFPVQAGHAGTVEVVATDESGAVSTTKAMPLIGVWHASDANGTLPTIAKAVSAFNSTRLGMTQVRASFAVDENVRIAITDSRGDGRPDYTYRARVLYASSVAPTRLAASGGAVVIKGTGFSASCGVTIGGVSANVVSVSPTEMHVIAPAISAGGAKDVVVTDLTTRGTASITGGVVYSGSSSDKLTLTAQPSGSVAVGSPAALALHLADASGNPVVNGQVTVSPGAGNVTLGICNLSQCTLVTDAHGNAHTMVIANAAGSITLKAVSGGGSAVSASYTAVGLSQAIALLRPTEYVASGAGARFNPAVQVTANGTAAMGQAVQWTQSSLSAGLGSATSQANTTGLSTVAAEGSLRNGELATVTACAWSSVCATQNLIGVAASDLRATAVSGDAQNLSTSDSLADVGLKVVDTDGHPVVGANVTVYQSVSGWQPPCITGRCPVAPLYGKSTSTIMSDDDGLITVSPLQYANTAAVTLITASVGTQGALTVTLQKAP